MMWGALIGAAGSLIGGAMQSKSAKNAANQERSWAVEDQAEQFVRLRAAAEKAGFNPLTALGAAPNSGMVNPTQAAQSYMGEAIATSSLMLADSMSKTAAAATGKKLQNANRANADLTRKLNAATLRPKMAGVFERPSKFGTGAKNDNVDTADNNLGDTFANSFVRPTGLSYGLSAPKKTEITAAASDQGTLPAVTPLYTPFGTIFPQRRFSDADVGTSRYGEGYDIMGFASFIDDAAWNVGRVVKNGSTDPKYRIDVRPNFGWGSPDMRETKSRGWRRAHTLGFGARNQGF
jgi:hypothetical protein